MQRPSAVLNMEVILEKTSSILLIAKELKDLSLPVIQTLLLVLPLMKQQALCAKVNEYSVLSVA